MIRVNLNPEQRHELEAYRSSARSEIAERALMVLMSADGVSPPEIARRLKRHPHTVRHWLRRYGDSGLPGLNRRYAPGRAPDLRREVMDAVEEALGHPPGDFKYPVSLWTTSLLVEWLRCHKSIEASQDTVERALKDAGFRFRRSAATVPAHAPSKEEKRAAIGTLVEEIKAAIDSQDCEVLALDESHFSTEPYVLSGWQKKLWPPEDPDSEKARTHHCVWRLEFGDAEILLEERRAR